MQQSYLQWLLYPANISTMNWIIKDVYVKIMCVYKILKTHLEPKEVYMVCNKKVI